MKPFATQDQNNKQGPHAEDLTRSADLVGRNVEALKQLFPQAVTEERIDFEVLKQLLGGAVDERDEKYGLNWHGKRQARQLALTPSTGTLRPTPEDSVDWDTTQNLMIEGDNLEVLKLLQKSYAGEVKLIYIDPPYNTGGDFVYPDNFQDNIRNYLEITGQTEEGIRLSSNPESSGRFHTAWLNMVYPRLRLAQNLLRMDGVILISIDDNEFENLRLICNEIFGEENFVAQLFWEKGRKNDAKLFSSGQDYILVYARSKQRLTELQTKWREAKPGAAEVQNEYLSLKAIYGDDVQSIQEALRAWYGNLPKTNPAKKLSRYGNVDANGVWRDDNMSWPGGGGPTYDLPHDKTGVPCKVPDGGWRYSTLETMLEKIREGKVVFREDHSEPPIRKTYLVRENEDDEGDLSEEEDGEVGIHVAGTYFYRSALQASNLMASLFGSKVFNNPKDHEVLARWIAYIDASTRDGIILDFFAGSGSTGHAVLQQNFNDGGSRRFILVQLPEPLDSENKDQKLAAKFCDSLGKPRNIAELTKERLRRAAARLKQENPTFSGDTGFRVFRLDSTNIRPWEPNRDKLAETLEESVEHIKAGRTDQDILFEILLKLGLELTVPIETRFIASKTVYSVGLGTLLVCLAESIQATEVESLALGIVDWHTAVAPAVDSTVVFRDSAFADDVAKTNLTAILTQHGLENVRSL